MLDEKSSERKNKDYTFPIQLDII